MARTISDEQLQLKKRARRRLIGAITLVTLMVLLLPMLLDGEPKPVSQDIKIQIPAQNGGNFASRVIPVPEKTGTAEAGIKPHQAETAASSPLPVFLSCGYPQPICRWLTGWERACWRRANGRNSPLHLGSASRSRRERCLEAMTSRGSPDRRDRRAEYDART